MTIAGLATREASRSSECIENVVFFPELRVSSPSLSILALINKVGKSINLIAIAGFLTL
jgi:hypothetical protein